MHISSPPDPPERLNGSSRRGASQGGSHSRNNQTHSRAAHTDDLPDLAALSLGDPPSPAVPAQREADRPTPPAQVRITVSPGAVVNVYTRAGTEGQQRATVTPLTSLGRRVISGPFSQVPTAQLGGSLSIPASPIRRRAQGGTSPAPSRSPVLSSPARGRVPALGSPARGLTPAPSAHIRTPVSPGPILNSGSSRTLAGASARLRSTPLPSPLLGLSQIQPEVNAPRWGSPLPSVAAHPIIIDRQSDNNNRFYDVDHSEGEYENSVSDINAFDNFGDVPQPADEFIAPPDMFNNSWYVVTVGRRVGVFDSWEECNDATNGVPHNCHKKYTSRREAVARYFNAREAGRVNVVSTD
ncbi:uncharacterized protein BXZ73DRAFT_81539 [Epithele typhae]|uniref:uncharacterized protein n=1 Tax=Epithele typhae TaxID=378194 RepID=UPI0020075D35|nr:uncharacterized protein BXZ73DRAFT_81525 [Epithele typhae]XP_047872697.1 uncharacterized protein BXZ73DRAFT_81539 [Epithele typhae]KAH9914761.1 hypothetical protein BXZ73DRAFT_81525 [Epithele typhae]KAH9914778.1 hypothetical protein BXZ73DRAFT_81539 [Epithele typhae]